MKILSQGASECLFLWFQIEFEGNLDFYVIFGMQILKFTKSVNLASNLKKTAIECILNQMFSHWNSFTQFQKWIFQKADDIY